MELASFLDSTNLRPEADENDIKILCDEAAKFKMAAVCIHPYRLTLAKKLLANNGVKLCTVIGFPLGAEGIAAKLYSASWALDNGADEIDVVINIGALKDGNPGVVRHEIDSLLGLKKNYNFILKVIVETALLTIDELILITRLISDSSADFIKTSTGFSTRGVSSEDIEIINQHKSPELKIKASGGIKSLDFALQLLNAGVHRLGTSNARKLIEENQSRGGL